MQRSFEDLGTPLREVTFCVVDLETTGGSPAADAITEIGAVKLRGGECLGTFQTLINPGVAIPPSITYLTGITESMVLPAPRIERVLPSFLEFARDSVLVGHNVRFDISFLDAAFARHGYPRIGNRVALAGFQNGDYGACVKDSTGAGYCYGTMRAFAHGPNVNDRADFFLNTNGNTSFYAYWNGLYYSCYFAPPFTPQMATFASFVGTTNGFFVVMWNASGVCADAYAYHGSDWGDF